MSNELPAHLHTVSEHRHDQYRARTFPDKGDPVRYYTEILRYDAEFRMPGHLCCRAKPVKYVVLGIHPETGMFSIYYGGRDIATAKRIAKQEAVNGAWLLEAENLPTAPNKHDYPQYQVRGNPGRPDPDPVAIEAAESGHRQDAVQG